MKLKRREKILAGLAAGLVGLMGLWFLLFAGDPRTDEQLLAEQTARTTEIDDKQKQLQAAARDAKRLAEWQRRALPPEPTLARSLYQAWLHSVATRVNLREYRIDSAESSVHRDQFTKITFTLHAQAKLGELVQFMYEFYSADFLHQIRKLAIKPNKSTRDLNVDISIEALSLPTASSKTQLPKGAGHGLQLAKLADYRDPIVKRDFFAPYRPTPPPSRRSGVDPADFAFVTGFTEVDGTANVWLQDRKTWKLWQLGNGETFTVGDVKGTVQAISQDGEVIVEFNGRRRRLHDGDNLHGGVEIQDPRPKQPEKRDNPPDSDPDEDN